MKKRRILGLFMVMGAFLLLCGCESKNNKNLDMSLTDIMTSVYKDIPDDKLPMMLGNNEINDDNLTYYTGLESLDYESALASESKVGSIAHSVVLLRVKDNVNIENVKKDIKEKVNPRKWICVGVDDNKNVIVDNIGNTIILIMDNDMANDLYNNFKALNK